MPATLTYPGVYVEELESSQHTITGVATSIAAFIGWAPKGPIDQAIMVESMPEFQATFGDFVPGVWLAYAVNHFFLNGGQQAYIVRLVDGAKPSSVKWPGGTDSLFAKNPGIWGDSLRVTITPQSAGSTRCSLLVQLLQPNGSLTTLESFDNLSCTAPDARYIVTVIDADSTVLSFIDPTTSTAAKITGSAPALTTLSLAGGSDGTVLLPSVSAAAVTFETELVAAGTGIDLLRQVPIFNLLCVPGETDFGTINTLQQFCHDSRAFLIIDAPPDATLAKLTTIGGPYGTTVGSAPTALAASGQFASYSGYYFPWVLAPDPAAGGRPTPLPPCGVVAGQFASTDTNRGVWKAPAGIATSLSQVLAPQVLLTDPQQGQLNPLAVNCLRTFRNTGTVIWGARTVAGADLVGSQWKYVPVRRLALFIESSLYAGTQWVVFEPNDEPLWGQIRLNVGTFMQGLFLQGAFAGTTPQVAYFVKCDATNNPASSVALGVVNVLVGFAPLDPAEFVVIQIQQIAGQAS